MMNGFSQSPGASAPVLSRGPRFVSALALIAALSACAEGGDFPMFQSKAVADGEEVATRRATRLIERDVEAPDVFQVTEAGLWDGRPSLGGVWVAHPDVKEPERVLIRNTANDKFVIGALFRRERENPGPRVQVSSDAAAALGMLAGAPQNLNVTALRREEIPQAAELSQAPEGAAQVPASETVAAATGAIDRAEGPSDATVALADTAPAAAPERKQGFFAKLFGKRTPDAPTPAIAAAPATLDGTMPSAPEVQTATLDAAGSVMPPAPAPAPAPQASVQPVSVPAPAVTAPRASLEKPYLQIGIFSVEENARNTATAMKQAGMIPTVRKQSSQGKTFWRVLIGPATSTGERSQLLDKVKASGFTDAYAVTN